MIRHNFYRQLVLFFIGFYHDASNAAFPSTAISIRGANNDVFANAFVMPSSLWKPWRSTVKCRTRSMPNVLRTSKRSIDVNVNPNGDDARRVARLSRSKRTHTDSKIVDSECPVDILPKQHVARVRTPPFPNAAYSSLEQEEESQSWNYISFVDQTFLKTYSEQSRLVEPRRYALSDQFNLAANANTPPTIDDIAMPPSNYGPIARSFAWNTLPARAVVGSASYFAFPLLIEFLDANVGFMDTIELTELVDGFLPGVAIVLGTYFSLTISILYDRLTKLTEVVNVECSQLALTLVNLLHVFEDNDPEAAVEGAQCIADQVRVLVHDSRGRETMGVIYNDPYARLLRLLKDYSNTDACSSLVEDAYLLSDLHGNAGSLFQLRTDRLTVESLALSPTHFDVMTFLSGLLLTGFALGTLATATEDGVPTETARVLFAALVVCYTIFYEMAFDLNRPFDGVYQLRRSGAAMHLLQIKQIICNNPVTKGKVDFEAIPNDDGEYMEDCDEKGQDRKAHIWYN